MIRVLLVDDSAIVLAILQRVLNAPETGITVVGTAHNGVEALELIPRLDPQVILTDLHMPIMDGLKFTRAVMEHYPRPILIVSVAAEESRQDDEIFNLLEAGAIDIYAKPRHGLIDATNQVATSELIRKIRILSGVKVFSRRMSTTTKALSPTAAVPRLPPSQSHNRDIALAISSFSTLPKIIAIGASTGGPQALLQIISPLPGHFPIPIVVIQHIGKGFTQSFCSWLGHHSALSVAFAQDGETPKRGNLYLPKEDHHLVFNARGGFQHAPAKLNELHCPSVDYTFVSLAETYGKQAMGVLLTGMGQDGAHGLLKIKTLGGRTLAESEESCVVFGMPQQAIVLGAAEHILPLKEISSLLLTFARS